MRQLLFVSALFACSSLSAVVHAALPQCEDGIDNDGDGLIDYPADPGCTSPTDDSELNGPDAGFQGLLDLSSTDLPPGSSDDDGGTGFMKVDGGSVGGTPPPATTQAPRTAPVHGCDYAASGTSTNGVAFAALMLGAALVLSRRRRVV
jgi:MYXO-CTERM domain-containing protein